MDSSIKIRIRILSNSENEVAAVKLCRIDLFRFVPPLLHFSSTSHEISSHFLRSAYVKARSDMAVLELLLETHNYFCSTIETDQLHIINVIALKLWKGIFFILYQLFQLPKPYSNRKSERNSK